MKGIIVLLLGLLFVQNLFAQSNKATDKDTLLYYMNNNNQLVKTKAEADYFLLIMPADSSSGTKIYPVIEYYTTMNKKLISYSLSQSYNSLVFEGQYADFYPNGHRKSVKNYSRGSLLGNMTYYYPNGKLYADEAYDKDGNLLLINCQDSTGNILATNGNGKWIEYDDKFKVKAKGDVKDSLQNGSWTEKRPNNTVITMYRMGLLIYTDSPQLIVFKKSDSIYTYLSKKPQYHGDFNSYMERHLHYLVTTLTDNATVRFYARFIVEKDGSLSNIQLINSSGLTDMDDQAIKLLSVCPKWEPGMIENKPVRCVLMVPINIRRTTQYY